MPTVPRPRVPARKTLPLADQRHALLMAALMLHPFARTLSTRVAAVAHALPTELVELLPGISDALDAVLSACGLDPNDEPALHKALTDCQAQVAQALYGAAAAGN